MACLVHRNSAEFEGLALFERLNCHSFQGWSPWTPVGVLTVQPHTSQLCLSHPSDVMFPRMENTTIFIPDLKYVKSILLKAQT